MLSSQIQINVPAKIRIIPDIPIKYQQSNNKKQRIYLRHKIKNNEDMLDF